MAPLGLMPCTCIYSLHLVCLSLFYPMMILTAEEADAHSRQEEKADSDGRHAAGFRPGIRNRRIPLPLLLGRLQVTQPATQQLAGDSMPSPLSSSQHVTIVYNFLPPTATRKYCCACPQSPPIVTSWFSTVSTVKNLASKTSLKRQQIFLKIFFRESECYIVCNYAINIVKSKIVQPYR